VCSFYGAPSSTDFSLFYSDQAIILHVQDSYFETLAYDTNTILFSLVGTGIFVNSAIHKCVEVLKSPAGLSGNLDVSLYQCTIRNPTNGACYCGRMTNLLPVFVDCILIHTESSFDKPWFQGSSSFEVRIECSCFWSRGSSSEIAVSAATVFIDGSSHVYMNRSKRRLNPSVWLLNKRPVVYLPEPLISQVLLPFWRLPYLLERATSQRVWHWPIPFTWTG
jgi:hypothetical protein